MLPRVIWRAGRPERTDDRRSSRRARDGYVVRDDKFRSLWAHAIAARSRAAWNTAAPYGFFAIAIPDYQNNNDHPVEAGPTHRAKGVVIMTTVAPAVPTAWYWNRWYQLVLGLIAMMTISSPQYVWTLFTGPLNQKLGTTLAELQWTFSLLIILQTWCSPLQAYLVDKFGPRRLISVGALMSGGGMTRRHQGAHDAA